MSAEKSRNRKPGFRGRATGRGAAASKGGRGAATGKTGAKTRVAGQMMSAKEGAKAVQAQNAAKSQKAAKASLGVGGRASVKGRGETKLEVTSGAGGRTGGSRSRAVKAGRKASGLKASGLKASGPGRGAGRKPPGVAKKSAQGTRAGGNARSGGGLKSGAGLVSTRGPKAAGGDGRLRFLSEPMRIAKVMARAGLCSRRDAEAWIEAGRVRVNGKVLASPAIEVGPKDRVLVDGAPIPAWEGPRLWRFHKPKGCVTTARDPEGRTTVFDLLPDDVPRVLSVGRLDYNTEGLLLLTNDGALKRYLELPSTGWLRRYRVRAKGRVTQEALNALSEGLVVEGVRYGPIEATLDSEQGSNVWLTVGLREGKNREVRRVLGSLGLDVNRLIRVSYGPFQLLDLPSGETEHIRRRVLVDQLGPKLAQTFGLSREDEDDEAAGGAVLDRKRASQRRAGEGAKQGGGKAKLGKGDGGGGPGQKRQANRQQRAERPASRPSRRSRGSN